MSGWNMSGVWAGPTCQKGGAVRWDPYDRLVGGTNMSVWAGRPHMSAGVRQDPHVRKVGYTVGPTC